MAHRDIFILTGAGVSAESGMGTFRDAGGIWAEFDPYELATPEGFARNPEKVQAFYNLRRRNLLDAEPNAAHTALARLQDGLRARGGRALIVTQNIDDLHERGGARDVLHMHGELFKARCLDCAGAADWRTDIEADSVCPGCGAAGRLRPHVVWFGEMPLYLEAIFDALIACDLFVSIGTSGAVSPASEFVLEARGRGAPTLELNLEPSDGAHLFEDGRYGPATEVVPAWVEDVLADAR